MVLETCGVDPHDRSGAGAQGLAGVMPYHFQPGESGDDPWTNLRVGAGYYAQGLHSGGGDVGLAFAGYNGGHARIQKGYSYWPQETRTYYYLAMSIYQDIQNDLDVSPTISKLWLCRQVTTAQ